MKRTAIVLCLAALSISGAALAQSTVEIQKDGQQMRPAQTIRVSPASTGASRAPTPAEIQAAATKEKGEQMMPQATGMPPAHAPKAMSRSMTEAEKAAAETKERGEQMKPR